MELPDRSAPIKVLQLTDSHLGATPGDSLLGMDTDQSLQLVVAQVARQHPDIDLLLATGDIANHGSEAAYRRFADTVAPLCPQQLWLPGNHDLPATMQQVAAAYMPGVCDIGNWRIILLNSAVAGEVGGALAQAELARLQQLLAEDAAEHVLVCLHHHPVPSGCAWLDGQQVSNADALFNCLDQSPRVRALLWGHIHQEVDRRRRDVRLLATPSTCIQFAPGQRDFALDRENPGYRWLHLHRDGRIDTAVERIDQHFDIDYAHSGGY